MNPDPQGTPNSNLILPSTDWQRGIVPWCGFPRQSDMEPEALVFRESDQRWYWSNSADLRIPQSTWDALNAVPPRDPCGPAPSPPPEDTPSPPPPPALPPDTPTQFAAVYNDACATLNGLADEVDQITAAIADDVDRDLGAARAGADGVTDEVAGSADNDLIQAQQPVNKLVQRAIQDVQRDLTGASGDLMGAGATVPFNVAHMNAELEGNFLQMLANAFPQMGMALGIQPAVPGFPGIPNMLGGLGARPPGMGMPPAQAEADVPPGGALGQRPETLFMPPSDINDSLNWVPPAPLNADGTPAKWDPAPVPQRLPIDVPPPGARGISNPTSPPPPDCPPVCQPITVNVTVPPIVVPPPVNQIVNPVSPPRLPPPPPPPPPGTVFVGQPSSIQIANGYVTYNTDARSWVYNTPASPPPAAELIQVDAPPVNVNINNPAPPTYTQPSRLLTPIWATTVGETRPGKWNWNKPDVCAAVNAEIDRFKPGSLAVDVQTATSTVKTWYEEQLDKTLLPFQYSGGVNWSSGVKEFLSDVASTVQSKVDGAAQWVEDTAATRILAIVCGESTPNPGAAAAFAARLGIAKKIERNTGIPLDYLSMSLEYAFQYANPQYLPNQIRADGAFLAGTINEELWECWTRANGNLPEPARKAMLADASKPNIRDLIELFRRGHNTKANLLERCREQGVLNPLHVDEWLAITTAIPTQSDLIRFMVRDAADDSVASQYGYDEGFKDKYTDRIQEWAKALGLDETYFRYNWRSHWDVPSYTQLTEMIARLRPDRLERREWAAKWQPDPMEPQKLGAPPPPRAVTRDDVRRALQVNDMAPGWVEQLIDISYTPINRTDAIRAYMTGAFNDEQLKDAFLNVRYSERDANTMLAYYKRDKERRLRNITGSWSPRKVVSYYKQALLTHQEAYRLLADVLPSNALVEKTLDEAELDMIAADRAMQLKSVKRQYMLGEHSDKQLREILPELGIDGIHVQRLVPAWRIERDGRRKLPTVAMLSKWVKAAIISVEEARQRLLNLAYTPFDADRIIAAALSMDFEGAPPSGEELSEAIQEAVKNQTAARRMATTSLQGRLNQILREAARIWSELQRRRAHDGQPPLSPPVVGG